MQDLSNLAVNSMWPTSQLSGGRPSDNSTAHTAPGSPSAAADETDLDRQPFVEPQTHERSAIKDDNEAPNANRFTEGDTWRETPGHSFPNTRGPAGTRAALLNSNPERRSP